MAGTFKLELVTPERVVISEDASQVVVPGIEGAFTVLPDHAPVISALRPGVVDATLGEGRNVRVFVKGGFVEIDTGRVVVLADRASNVEAMDSALIAKELEAAEADLAAAATDADKLAAASAVDQLRALGR